MQILKHIRDFRYSKHLCTLMAIYILNCIVDIPDLPNHPYSSIPEYEKETILEIILEEGLGFHDAIADDLDDESEENEQILKTKKVPDLFCNSCTLPTFGPKFHFISDLKSGNLPGSSFNLFDSFQGMIPSPPPDFA
jgi:hypothetical protein